MKRNRKVTSMILAVVMMLTCAFTSLAKETIQPRWSYFISIMGDMDVTTSGKATVLADVVADPTKGRQNYGNMQSAAFRRFYMENYKIMDRKFR